MRILTAAPIALAQDSWDRDITLLFRGLQEIGISSGCIRLNSLDQADFPGIQQTTRENMQSSSWWSSLGANAVILNSWGDPRYTTIAKAIKDADLDLMIRMDSNGLNSPWVNLPLYGHFTYDRFRDRGMNPIKAGLATIAKTPIYAIPHVHDLRMLEQLDLADYIGIESDEGYQRLKRLLELYNRRRLICKIKIVRHPASPAAVRHPLDHFPEKKNYIVAVGRWQSYQKNPSLLIKTLIKALGQNTSWKAHIIGGGNSLIKDLLKKAPESISKRILVHGKLPHDDVVRYYHESRICMTTSRYESGPLVASEALCCGCSCFAQDNGKVPLEFIRRIQGGDGTDAKTAAGLANGLLAEMKLWDDDLYTPKLIAEKAREEFAYINVARRAASLFTSK